MPNLPRLFIRFSFIFFQVIIESISVVCVNIFVLISGWFGIRPTFRGLFAFIFQCIYFLSGTYIVTCSIGISEFSLTGLKGCLFLLPSTNWFLRAYIGLYILSPILNIFLDKISNKGLLQFLIVFYVFQTVYGCTNISEFINWGYSTFSFIGLYCLARYVRYCISDKYKTVGWILIICIFINSLLFYISCYLKKDGFIYVYSYINPFVIISSCCYLLIIRRIRMGVSPVFNYLSKSAFAVYLLHASPFIFNNYYKPIIQELYYSHHTVILGWIKIIIFILLVFITAICLDLPRRYIWKKIENYFPNIFY